MSNSKSVPSTYTTMAEIFQHVDQRITLCANISEIVLVLLINEQGEKEKGRDEREFCWCSFLGGFGWRGTKRRRAWRAAARTLNMNDRLRVQVPYRACWRQL
jgi:hypothetical protein